MQALEVVMGHTGTQSRKKRKQMVEEVVSLEDEIAFKAYQKNMSAWANISLDLMLFVWDLLKRLDREGVNPSNTQADAKKEVFLEDLSYREDGPPFRKVSSSDLITAIRCIATRGYTASLGSYHTGWFGYGDEFEKKQNLPRTCCCVLVIRATPCPKSFVTYPFPVRFPTKFKFDDDESDDAESDDESDADSESDDGESD